MREFSPRWRLAGLVNAESECRVGNSGEGSREIEDVAREAGRSSFALLALTAEACLEELDPALARTRGTSRPDEPLEAALEFDI